jgi:hypothetical protein
MPRAPNPPATVRPSEPASHLSFAAGHAPALCQQLCGESRTRASPPTSVLLVQVAGGVATSWPVTPVRRGSWVVPSGTTRSLPGRPARNWCACRTVTPPADQLGARPQQTEIRPAGRRDSGSPQCRRVPAGVRWCGVARKTLSMDGCPLWTAAGAGSHRPTRPSRRGAHGTLEYLGWPVIEENAPARQHLGRTKVPSRRLLQGGGGGNRWATSGGPSVYCRACSSNLRSAPVWRRSCW